MQIQTAAQEETPTPFSDTKSRSRLKPAKTGKEKSKLGLSKRAPTASLLVEYEDTYTN